MTKHILILSMLFFSAAATMYAQNEYDALRYSQYTISGTARSTALGGSMGAVGGDISVLTTNPAGIAVFRQNEFLFTPTYMTDNVESTFITDGTSVSDNTYKLKLNNIGFVASFALDEANGWSNVNIAFSYNKLGDFHRNIYLKGRNTLNSRIDTWVNDMNDFARSEVYENGHYNLYEDLDKLTLYEEMAYYSGLVPTETVKTEYDDGTEEIYTEYWSHVSDDMDIDLLQKKNMQYRGYSDEYNIAFGANYNHSLYLGGSLNLSSFNSEINSSYSESDDMNYTPVFNSFELHEHIKTRGTGFNLKLGLIYKPIDWVRLGAAIHTPTIYSIDEDYSAELTPYLEQGGETDRLEYSEFSYDLTSPSRAMGSIALMIKKSGFLSFEYELVDYSKIKMRSSVPDDFDYENEQIAHSFTAAHNIRAGAEYRLGMVSLRAGYALYGSPYKSSVERKDETRQIISGGIGFNSGNYYLDIAYSRMLNEFSEYLYETYSGEEFVGAHMKSQTGNIMMTFGMRF